MENTHDLFVAIGEFRKYLAKAMKGKRYRSYFYLQAENCLIRIGNLLEDPQVTRDVNQLLKIVQQETNQPGAFKSAQAVVRKDEPAFLRAENSLHHLTGLKYNDYKQIVDLIKYLSPQRELCGFPVTAQELRANFQEKANEFLELSKASKELPRHQKNEYKSAIRAQMWRYCVGTLMTLGNVGGFLYTLHTVGPVTAGVGGLSIGRASCKFGVALFKETTKVKRPKPPRAVRPTNNPPNRQAAGS